MLIINSYCITSCFGLAKLINNVNVFLAVTLFIIMTRVLSRIQAPPLFPTRPTASPYWVCANCSLLFTSIALEYGRFVVVNFVVPLGRCEGEGRFSPWEERCHLRDTLLCEECAHLSLSFFLGQPSKGQVDLSVNNPMTPTPQPLGNPGSPFFSRLSIKSLIEKVS